MKEGEFRGWLEARRWNGKGLTGKGINNRMSRLRRVERSLEELGFASNDLEGVMDRGEWDSLLSRLRDLIEQGSAAQPPKSLVPQAEDPEGQLRNLLAVTRLYGNFRTNPKLDQDPIDGLRAAFLDRIPDFIDFQRREGSYWDIERRYKDEIIAKVQAITASDTPEERAGKELYRAMMPNKGPLVRWQTEDAMTRQHPDQLPEFYTVIARLARSTAAPVEAIGEAVAALQRLRAEGATALAFGQISAITFTTLGCARPEASAPFKATKAQQLTKLLRGEPQMKGPDLTDEDVRSWLSLLSDLRDRLESWGWKPRDLFDVQGFAWVALDENWLDEDDEDEADSEASNADRIRAHVLAQHIEPARAAGLDELTIKVGQIHAEMGLVNNWANVAQALQGPKFQAMAKVSKPRLGGAEGGEKMVLTFDLSSESKMMAAATNLILYGPPGTGKTYRTAREAVALCDGAASEDREALMQRYAELVTEQRISFVTFHQNFSYEEFVQGLRPVTVDEEGKPLNGGFRLAPVDGVFKQIADRALANAAQEAGRLDRTRSIFKIALGRRNEQQSQIREGLDNNLIHLGWGGGIDWSDEVFEDLETIKLHWQTEKDPNATGKDPNIEMMYTFRAAMETDDYVVLSDGRDRFTAFGQITGDYYFDKAAAYHPHRRGVKWLWKSDAGEERSTFYSNEFRRHSTYRLRTELIDWDALDRIVVGTQSADQLGGKPFVLIIDEINRANISKVFGELITLIEPDKRLGELNELRVRLPYSEPLFAVPPNLHIVGTMNTADRSIALLDTALRRRFIFREIAPEPSRLAETVDGVPLRRVLEVLNERIEYLVDREHRIGHAFFMSCETRADVDTAIRDKVIPLLQEYYFEDWSRLAATLGEPSGKSGGFLDYRLLKDPTGLGNEDRPSWSVRESFAADAYERLIGKAIPASDGAATDEAASVA